MDTEYSYFTNLAIAFDQLLNTLFGGSCDETLSAKAFRLKDNNSIPYKIINSIFFWQKDHCYEAFLSELKRIQLPEEYRIHSVKRSRTVSKTRKEES